MRTKVFVSYSHHDQNWLDLLKQHLALLERRDIVQLWSDTRIRVGAQWDTEIQQALTESRAAVLLVTPALLASDYIWRHEIPHILKHQEQGMLVFPLIARPCAWRIAPELAALQARPTDGRALSLGTESDIDRELADFAYELAGLLAQLLASVASDEADLIRRRDDGPTVTRRTVSSGRPSRSGAPRRESKTVDAAWAALHHAWSGVYSPTNLRLRVAVESRRDATFSGTIHYLDDGSVTEIEGSMVSGEEILDRTPQIERTANGSPGDVAIAFKEVRFLKKGGTPIDFNGEYRAVVYGTRMLGVWLHNERVLGQFEFRRED